MKTGPNFLVLGAARSGTTLLHSYLLQHPEIYLPKSKQPEPHFFLKSEHYQKGSEWYHERYFSAVNDEKAIGEISTSYLFGENVAGRIASYNPLLKFIVVLREPKQRAYSNYWHSFKNGFEEIPFDEAIRNEQDRLLGLDEKLKEIAPYAYVGRSLYFEQLERYLNYFDPSQFYVFLFEHFINNPKKYLNEICRFLAVNDNFQWTDINEKANASNPGMEMTEDSRSFLNDIFESENEKLAELFDLNLKQWT